MGYSKYELSTKNMLCSLKKFGHFTPLHAHNGHLSTTALFSVPKEAVMENFSCSIFQRQKTWHCILTFLWLNWLNPRTVRLVLKTFSVFSTMALIWMWILVTSHLLFSLVREHRLSVTANLENQKSEVVGNKTLSREPVLKCFEGI